MGWFGFCCNFVLCAGAGSQEWRADLAASVGQKTRPTRKGSLRIIFKNITSYYDRGIRLRVPPHPYTPNTKILKFYVFFFSYVLYIYKSLIQRIFCVFLTI